VKGFIAGIIGLTLLQVALANSTHTAAAIGVPLGILSRWLDPNVPLIPDRRTN
jgi:hypothetical protein